MSWFYKEVQSSHEGGQPPWKFITIKVYVVIYLNDSEITQSQVILLNILWQPCPK